MKKIIYCSSLIAVIGGAGGAMALQPKLAAPVVPRILMLAQAEAPAPVAALPATIPPATPEDPADVPSLPPAPEPRFGGRGGGAGSMGGGGGNFSYFPRGNNGLGSAAMGRAESGALVIPATETDPQTLADTEEDLIIMGRILEKAVDQNGGEEERQAMGIRLFSISGSGGVKNLEIDGFGAVFLLNVNFPLVGPVAKPSEGVTNEVSNSTWDEARRELYGPPPGAENDPFAEAGYPREEYDPKRVEKLKGTLLEALKNASNMRNLKPNETVTVVVTGGGGGGGPAYGNNNFQPGPRRAFQRDRASTATPWGNGPLNNGVIVVGPRMNPGVNPPGASVLTIRVKKSDIDSFAKGKLSRDEFHAKATVLRYLTASTTSTAALPVLMNLQAK